jgi:hypothetical protein
MMTDTPVAAAAFAAETEALRTLAAEAAPDNPNPTTETAPHPDPLPARESILCYVIDFI